LRSFVFSSEWSEAFGFPDDHANGAFFGPFAMNEKKMCEAARRFGLSETWRSKA
jgi:hypothetical protein